MSRRLLQMELTDKLAVVAMAVKAAVALAPELMTPAYTVQGGSGGLGGGGKVIGPRYFYIHQHNRSSYVYKPEFWVHFIVSCRIFRALFANFGASIGASSY